jgi:hypothetical protein
MPLGMQILTFHRHGQKLQIPTRARSMAIEHNPTCRQVPELQSGQCNRFGM